MRHSYEYKRKCVEMYRPGQWPETSDGIMEQKNSDKSKMDAPCKMQGNIHLCCLVHKSMCPGF